MDARAVLHALFPEGCDLSVSGSVITGEASLAGHYIRVIGTTDRVAVGVEIALQLAAAILACIREHPGSPILLLVDTSGQRLSRRDEMLGLNGYMAHLARCVDAARRQGSSIIGLVYAEAVSGGFLATGLLADECYALPEAQIRVMNLAAMSRVTKQPLDRLQWLSTSSPIFSPGAVNYYVMGGIREIWEGDLSQRLIEALAASSSMDRRSLDAFARGGRTQAAKISQYVRDVPC